MRVQLHLGTDFCEKPVEISVYCEISNSITIDRRAMGLNTLSAKLLFWAALGLIVFSSYSCSEPASPYVQTEIILTALDASCTEVWLDLKFNNLTQPANGAIQKDGKDFHQLLSLNRDTLLVFEDLESSTNYYFRAIIRHEGKDDKISNIIRV